MFRARPGVRASIYSGSQLAAAKQLLADAKEKRDLLKGKGVTAHREVVAPDSEVSIPDPVYPVFLARNKSPGDTYYTLGMLKGGGLRERSQLRISGAGAEAQ